jgi:hypothetical protein
MANINAALPTAIAVPFHPATEALHHENLIRPVIPKPEVITPYAKFREGEDNPQFSAQAREFIQDENRHERSQNNEKNQVTAQQRRLSFFAKRRELERESESKALIIIKDFKLSVSVIQEKYNNAVNPISDPTIDYAI